MKDYSVLEGLDNNFMIELRCAYDRGYRQGRDDEWAETQAKQKEDEYERGLNDAWRVITEFLLMGDFDRGMTFNTRFLDELLKLEPKMAVERLKEYKEKSEPIVKCCKNCKHNYKGMLGDTERCESCYYDEVTKANTMFEPMETDNSKIEVGDEIVYSDPLKGEEKGIVMGVCNNWVEVKFLKSWNCVGVHKDSVKKTGRHFEQLDEILETMKNE